MTSEPVIDRVLRFVEIDGTVYEFNENHYCPLAYIRNGVLCCAHPSSPIIGMICNNSKCPARIKMGVQP